MEPPQSKFITNQVELQAFLLVTTELLMIDSETTIRLAVETKTLNSNNNQQDLLPLLLTHRFLLEAQLKSKNSQSLPLNKCNNNRSSKSEEASKEVSQALAQDPSPQSNTLATHQVANPTSPLVDFCVILLFDNQ
jgi:hypothetical protein